MMTDDNDNRTRSTVRERRAEELKRQMIDAAISILASEGLGESTTAEIARRAEVSESSIFWHFGSREGLLQEVAVDLLDRVGVGTEDIADESLSLRERVMRVIDHHVKIARYERDSLRAISILLNEGHLMDSVRPSINNMIRERRKPVAELIKRAAAAGEINPISPVVLLEFLSGSAIGMYAHLRHHRKGYNPEPMFRALRIAGLALVGLDEDGDRIGKLV